jgi:iron complex transport system permease protein
MMSAAIRLRLVGLGVLLIILFFASLVSGAIAVPLSEIYATITGTHGEFTDIILSFRIPKAATCVLGGAALAVSGLLMQTLFRNPLAGPDVLGLSAGAGLLVALTIMTGQVSGMLFFGSPWTVALAAGAGAAMVFLIVLFIARFVPDNTSLLIIGLMISATTSSLVAVIQYVSRAEDLQTFMIWGLGSVGATNWTEIQVLFVVVGLGIGISFALMKPLNTLLLGENYAKSLGINISRSRVLILAATCLMTGAVTAFCGPIAFVGLAVPHLVRMGLPTTNHKIMIPAVAMGGASLLLICDLLAQLPGSTQLLPLNAVTSLIGAPVVIWLIVKSKRIRM